METYKTFKSTKNENEVQSFLNQRNEIQIIVLIENKEFGLTFYADETIEERTNDFLAEYGKNENSLKAIELINKFIENNL